jgi:hypothetical protein
MNESILQTITLITSGLTLFGLFVLAVVVRRSIRSHQTPEEAIQTKSVRDSPILRLSFIESLNGETFATANDESAGSELGEMLNSRAADGVTLTINAVHLLGSGAELVVSASARGQKLLESGVAVISQHSSSGKVLPILRDRETGQIIELLKGEFKNPFQLAALSAAVIGAAHMIAGADIAKRLKQVGARLDLLIAYRHIDQMSTLERIYTAAKELIVGPLGEEERWEMWRLRNELRELRLAWRREFHHHLNLIEDPQQAGWFDRMFTFQKTSDEQIYGKITDAQINLALLEYSLRLDHALAVTGGSIEKFQRTLADELNELQEVAGLLQSKAALISGRYKEVNVDPAVTAMSAIVQHYKNLLPEQSLVSTPCVKQP